MRLDPESSERRLRRTAWLAVLGLSLSGLAFGASFAAGVAAGGVLSVLNLEGIAKLVRFIPADSRTSASWLAILGVSLRYLLLGFGLFVIVTVWRVNVLALSLGLSAPVLAVLLELGLGAVKEFRRDRDGDS